MSEVTRPSSSIAARPRVGTSRRLFLGRDAATVYGLAVVLVIACIIVPYFASIQTIDFLLIDAIPIMLMAMPMALIIITGEIDLSVASTAGLSAVSMGVLFHTAGWNIWAAMIAAVVIGALCGAFNGFLITVVGLPSLAVTIGTLALYRGLALVVIGDQPVADFPLSLTSFSTSTIGATGIPSVMVIVLVVILIFGVLLHFTPFGRGLFALGFSKEAARFVGIRVGHSKFSLFLASGIVSSLAGIFWAFRYSSAQSDSVQGLELSVVAAVLLGGVSVFGGSGGIVGVVAAVLLIRTVNYSLELAGVDDTVLTVVTGGLLILSVIAPSVIARVRRFLLARRTKHSFHNAPAS
jgi:rhamnose transport system permease protein